MLRTLALTLLVLNALFFGWTRGWLDGVVGLKAQGDREPERLSRQQHPERVQLLAALPPQPARCLAVGPLEGDTVLAGAQAALERAGVEASQWQLQTREQAGVWAVATIRLGSKDFQARKEETYKRLKISYEFLQGPPDEMPTLILSRQPSERAANAALENFSQRALKGLRVMQLQAPSRQHSLVFAQADAALQGRLRNAGLGARACPAVPPADAASAAVPPASSASAASAG